MKNSNIPYVIQLDSVEIPTLIEKRQRNSTSYIKYGKDNQYPTYLWNLYNNSSDHQAIIDGLVKYTLGKGIHSSNPNVEAFFNQVNEDETINDVMSKAILDYFIFGGFNLHKIPNKGGQMAKIYWIDFMDVRINEDEDIIFYAEDWDRWKQAEIKEYSGFKAAKPTEEQMFYFKGNKTRGVYPIPLYNAAIRSINTDIEIAKFHFNNIANGFQVNTIISFNNGLPTETQKEDIERLINKKFSGTNGSKILITWNESKEKETTVAKLNADNFGEQFATLKKDVQNTIFTAHQVTSPALFGIKMENTGFSKTEYREAFEIFNQTIIKSHQDIIISELFKLLKPHFPNLSKTDLFIEPYEILFTDDTNNGNHI